MGLERAAVVTRATLGEAWGGAAETIAALRVVRGGIGSGRRSLY